MQDQKREHLRSLVYIHLSCFILGGTALFAKLIHLPAVDIIALRASVAALGLLAVILLFNPTALRLKSAGIAGWLLVMGVLMALHWVSYFHALQVSSVAIAVISLYSFPVITIFLEPLLIPEVKLSRRDVITALPVLPGIYLLVPDFSLSGAAGVGLLWGLFSAVCLSFRNVLYRRHLAGRLKGMPSGLYQIALIALLTLPFISGVLSGAPVRSGLDEWTLIILLGLVFTALPHTLIIFALGHLRAGTVGLVACMQVLYAVVFAALLLNEVPDWNVVLGGLIIVGVAARASAG